MPHAQGIEHFNITDNGLHRAGDLAGTEAAGAHMNMFWGTVHDRLYALDVGLPGTIGTAVRVGNPNPESDALTAKITFGHDLNLLAGQNYILRKTLFIY